MPLKNNSLHSIIIVDNELNLYRKKNKNLFCRVKNFNLLLRQRHYIYLIIVYKNTIYSSCVN